jgi:hypothetical protein
MNMNSSANSSMEDHYAKAAICLAKKIALPFDADVYI